MSMTAPQNRSSVSRKTTTSGSVCPEVDRRAVSSVCDMKSMRYAGGAPNDLFGCFTQRRPSGTFRPSLERGLLVHIQGCRTLALVSTLTRRQLLYRAGTAAAAALAAEGGIAAAARGAPTVLVIGGGLAGLSATRSLRHRGHHVRLFEASDRLGGRVWTLRGFLAGGQVSEHGGEFVSSEHSAMRGLARKFGLGLENTLSYPAGTRDRYYFDGGRYPLARGRRPTGPRSSRSSARRCGRPAIPTTYRPPHGRRARARPDDGRGVDRAVAPGRARLAARRARRQLVRRRVRRRHRPPERAQHRLPARVRHPPRLLAGRHRREVPRPWQERPGARRARRGHPRRGRRDGRRAASRSAAGRAARASARSRGAAAPTSRRRPTASSSRSRSRCSAASTSRGPASRRGSSTRSTTCRWGRTPSCTSSSASATGIGADSDGTTYADTGYESCWEATTAEPGRQGVLVQYTGGRLGRFPGMPAHGPARAGARPPVPAPAPAGAPRRRGALERPRPGSTTGRRIRGRTAPTATGAPATTPASPGTRACPRARSISPASTRRSTSRATWRALSAAAAARPARSAETKNARLDARATRPAGQLRDGRGRGVVPPGDSIVHARRGGYPQTGGSEKRARQRLTCAHGVRAERDGGRMPGPNP